MRRTAYTSAITAVCIVAGLSGSTTQTCAGVINLPSRETITGPSPVENVHYRNWRHHRHYGYWRHRHYRYVYYYPRYGYYGFNPVGALAGAAVGLATAPLWALGGGWGYPYYW